MQAPAGPDFRVEWRALAQLEEIADQWRSLAARALEPNVFYEPAFALNAAPVFGRDARAALVWSGTRLMGLFPLRFERWQTGPGKILAGWVHSYAPLGMPLVDGEQAPCVIAAWLDDLAGDPANPGLLLLPLVPDEGAFAGVLKAVLARSGRQACPLGRHRRAQLAPAAERETYLERAVTLRRRKELRRQRRRLEEIAPVRFTSSAAPAEIAASLQEFMLLEASGWKGRAGTAAASDPEIRSFVETAVPALAAEGKAQVDRLSLNGRTIAAAITLRSGSTAWCWKIAYSEGVANSSPGVQLVMDLTGAMLADSKLASVDSCATADHPMINHIWRERLALSDQLIELRRSAWPFALACGFARLRRRTISIAKWLRAGLHRR
jgi:CelD/BcsL family acetyltransferase involved in cellulose biosynthesis